MNILSGNNAGLYSVLISSCYLNLDLGYWTYKSLNAGHFVVVEGDSSVIKGSSGQPFTFHFMMCSLIRIPRIDDERASRAVATE